MVLLWTAGDVFKTTYFITNQSPVQFWLCGSVQILIDGAILLQVLLYSRDTRVKLGWVRRNRHIQGACVQIQKQQSQMDCVFLSVALEHHPATNSPEQTASFLQSTGQNTFSCGPEEADKIVDIFSFCVIILWPERQQTGNCGRNWQLCKSRSTLFAIGPQQQTPPLESPAWLTPRPLFHSSVLVLRSMRASPFVRMFVCIWCFRSRLVCSCNRFLPSASCT